MARKTLFTMLLFVLLAIPALSSSAEAWGPATHVTLWQETTSDPTAVGVLADIVNANPDACLTGMMFPDSAVIYYYTRYKAYESLHDWNTADRIWEIAKTDRERAFAVCYKFHLAADGVSHNIYIPSQIRKTKVPNAIIHAISELKIESKYLNEITPQAFSRYEEFIPLMKEVTGKDWTTEAALLHKAIGGGRFYKESLAIPKAGLFNTVYHYSARFVGLFVSEKTDVPLVALSKEKMLEVLAGSDPILDPAGTVALREADASVNIWMWGIVLIIVLAAYWVLFKSKLLNRKKP